MEAFCVIREAMKANDVVGIARLVLYRRERAVLLEPQGKGIVLWTLRYGDEVREPVAELDEKTEIDSKLLTLMTQLVKEETKDWSPIMVQDPETPEIDAPWQAEELEEGRAREKTCTREIDGQCHQYHGCAEKEPGRGRRPEVAPMKKRPAILGKRHF